MKKIFNALLHLLLMGVAVAWCVMLVVKDIPRSTETPEQWRQKAERISDVSQLRELVVWDHRYILKLEGIADRLERSSILFAGLLSFYTLGAAVRILRRKGNDDAA
jgi:hypothetical protein